MGPWVVSFWLRRHSTSSRCNSACLKCGTCCVKRVPAATPVMEAFFAVAFFSDMSDLA